MPPLPLVRQPANQQHDATTAEVDVVWEAPTAAGLVCRNTDLVAVHISDGLDCFRFDQAGVGVGGPCQRQLVVDDRNGRGQIGVLKKKKREREKALAYSRSLPPGAHRRSPSGQLQGAPSAAPKKYA